MITLPEIHSLSLDILDTENAEWSSVPVNLPYAKWKENEIHKHACQEAEKLLPDLSTILCGHPDALAEVLPVGPGEPDLPEAIYLLSAPFHNDNSWATAIISAGRECAALMNEPSNV